MRTITVEVTAVNDAPDFTVGANQAAQASAGAITLNGWADISAARTFTITIGGSYQIYLPLLLGA